jgi:hypothetical protein
MRFSGAMKTKFTANSLRMKTQKISKPGKHQMKLRNKVRSQSRPAIYVICFHKKIQKLSIN